MNTYIITYIIKSSAIRAWTKRDDILIKKTIQAKNLAHAKKIAILHNKNKLFNHYDLKNITRKYKN